MSALLHHIGVVSDSSSIPLSDVTKVSAAVQKQVTRDFAPVWNVAATIDAFGSLEELPIDYWPVIIQDSIDDSGGYHTDQNGQPLAIISAGRDWTRAVSHECLEMLTDPSGNRVIAGDPPAQALSPLSELTRVNYL